MVTIADMFSSLLSRIEPTGSELEKFESHRYTITRRLKQAYGDVQVPLMGSYSRGSAVGASSDYDLLFNIPTDRVYWGDRLKSSNTVLTEVREELQDRYFQTEVGKDGQAVVCYFSDGKYRVDVVPGIYKGPLRDHNNYPLYWIPDGEGGWMSTSPQSHNKFINDEDARSRGKLKFVAKLIKFWRVCGRSSRIPLNSFHVELLLAQEAVCVGPKSYALCLSEAFSLLRDRECRALQDPLGISGYIKAANTESQREQALNAVNSAAERARRAVEAEDYGNGNEAFRLWNLVFNDQFPRS